MNNPLVSIVIPVYNGSNYLREAIESALAQTYKNIEIIVVNDGSNDNGATQLIALSYGDRIRYFEKENGGVSSALNLGIKEMKGEYFSWLSHDDLYRPQKIENQIELLKKYGFDKSSVALCGYEIIDSRSKVIGVGKDRFNEEMISWRTALYDVLKNGAYNGCAFLIRKEVLINAGLFDEKLRYLQDTLMWKKIFSMEKGVLYSHCRDVANRVHEKQLTQMGRSLLITELFVEADIILPIIARLSSKKNNYLFAYAQRCAHYGNKKLSGKCKEYATEETKFTAINNLKLRCIMMYGQARPTIRKLYYKVFRRINTE